MNTQVLVLKPITWYQRFAAKAAMRNLRPVMLECEKTQGEHCSVRFARVVNEHGVVTAVTDLCGRCPFGARHAVKAMTWSFGMGIFGPLLLVVDGPPNLKSMICTNCATPVLLSRSRDTLAPMGCTNCAMPLLMSGPTDCCGLGYGSDHRGC